MTKGKISRDEDKLVRDWLKTQYGIELPQFALWRVIPDKALEIIKEKHPTLRITAADIETAARRN